MTLTSKETAPWRGRLLRKSCLNKGHSSASTQTAHSRASSPRPGCRVTLLPAKLWEQVVFPQLWLAWSRVPRPRSPRSLGCGRSPGGLGEPGRERLGPAARKAAPAPSESPNSRACSPLRRLEGIARRRREGQLCRARAAGTGAAESAEGGGAGWGRGPLL